MALNLNADNGDCFAIEHIALYFARRVSYGGRAACSGEMYENNPCACRKSNSHIQMVKSAEEWRLHNAANGMNGAR